MDVKKQVFLFRILFFVVGLNIIALGINLNIVASFGVGGWDAYNIAMVERFGFSIGFWLNFNAILYILLSAWLRKTRWKIETIGTSLILGIFVDMWGILFQGIHMQTPVTKACLFFIAIITISIGAGIYLVSKLPPNPIDDLMLAITEHFQCSITCSKLLVEGTGVVIGFLLGGPIGIGTILMLIIFGPCIQFFYHFFDSIYKKLV